MFIMAVLSYIYDLPPAEPVQIDETMTDNPVPGASLLHFETQTLNDSNTTQTINLNQYGFKLHFVRNTSLEFKPVNLTIGVTSLQNFIPPSNATPWSEWFLLHQSLV